MVVKRWPRVPGREFSGELNTPLFKPTLSSLMKQVGVDAALALNNKQWDELRSAKVKKLLLLMKEYKIESDSQSPLCWVTLAFRLAEDFVPGMQIVDRGPRSGRKRTWTFRRRMDLYEAVETYMRDHDGTALNACRQLVKPDKPYAAKMGASREGAAKALYKQYGFAKRFRAHVAALKTKKIGKNADG